MGEEGIGLDKNVVAFGEVLKQDIHERKTENLRIGMRGRHRDSKDTRTGKVE